MDDILRSVFVFASNHDLMSPIRVSLTCKRWREVILDCPPAWRLDRLNEIPADHVATWIARSGDHRSLELEITKQDSDQWVSAIMPHRNRIELLRVYGHYDAIRRGFPNATTVVIYESSGATQPQPPLGTSFVTPELYPALKSLKVFSFGQFGSLIPTISASLPVTMLLLECLELRIWYRLLPSCASTIVTLHIGVELYREERLPPVVLPNLVVLVIGSSFLPLKLITPRMTFLGFVACEPNLFSSIDVSRVTTLSINKGVPERELPFPSFPSLRRMIVQTGTRYIHRFLDFLSATPTIHANLTQVVFHGMKFTPPEVEVAQTRGIALEYTLDFVSMEAEWKSSHIAN
jgi:F-box-like